MPLIFPHRALHRQANEWSPLAYGRDLFAWWSASRGENVVRDVSNVVSQINAVNVAPPLYAEGGPVFRAHNRLDFGAGVYFDGADDALSNADITGMPSGSAGRTLVFVMNKIATSGQRGLFGYGDGSTRGRVYLKLHESTGQPAATDGSSNPYYYDANVDDRVSVTTLTFDGGVQKLWVDGWMDSTGTVSGAFNTASNPGIVVCRDLLANQYYANIVLRDVVIFNRALSDYERKTVEKYFYNMYRCSYIRDTDHPGYPSANIIFEGDSITAQAAYGVAYSYSLQAPYIITNSNVSWYLAAGSGSTVGTMTGRAATVDGKIKTGAVNILSILIGTNDYGVDGDTVETFLGQLGTYLDARISSGWMSNGNKILLSTLLPRTSGAFSAWRTAANAQFRDWLGVKCSAINDFAANATMGPDAAASNAALYSDGLHPTLFGQQYLTDQIRWSLDSLIPPPIRYL
jgi:hypothetical protein